MHRIAVIDVGSNSVLMTIAEKKDLNGWKVLLDVASITMLIDGFSKNSTLSDEAMQKTLDAIFKFTGIARGKSVEKIIALGTMGLRSAKNSDYFIATVREKCGVEIKIIDSSDEARLTFTGVVSDIKSSSKNLLVIDIGGGSTEIILGQKEKLISSVSIGYGSLNISEIFKLSDIVEDDMLLNAAEFIHTMLKGHNLQFIINKCETMPIFTGGSICNIASVALGLKTFDSNKIRNYILSIDELNRQIELFRSVGLSERRRIEGLDPQRTTSIIGGALIAKEIMKEIEVDKIIISSRGLRHGVIEEYFMK
jgi:exopolyphosphatase/guanosine-5'-triphosphate,3'-diphosphate pyrophosphatase